MKNIRMRISACLAFLFTRTPSCGVPRFTPIYPKIKGIEKKKKNCCCYGGRVQKSLFTVRHAELFTLLF